MKIFGTDYDGVIINIEQLKANAFGKLLNKHWSVDLNETSNFWLATGGKSRRYKFDYFYSKAYHKQLADDIYQSVEQEYSMLLKTNFYPHVKLLPGAIELLQDMRKNFEFMFVSSGIPMEEIKYLVNLNGVSHYFDLILGTNDDYLSKRDHFKQIIEKKNPDEIIFIADSPEDMKITKEFPKTKAVGLVTNHSKKELTSAGADIIVQDLHEALKYFKSLF